MQRFKKLLVYAGTDQPESGIARAVSLAIENKATLTLIDVVKPQPKYFAAMRGVADPDELEDALVEDHRRRLYERAEEYADTAVNFEIVVKVGDPATEIIREVLRHNHDLVIKTADGDSGIQGTFFGSVARSLLRQCPSAVLILKPAIHGEFDQVLAAIDVQHHDSAHEKLNHDILSLAMAIATEDDAQLHLAAAWDLWMEKNLRRRAGDREVDHILETHRQATVRRMKNLLAQKSVDAENLKVHIKRGDPARVIRYLVDKNTSRLAGDGNSLSNRRIWILDWQYRRNRPDRRHLFCVWHSSPTVLSVQSN